MARQPVYFAAAHQRGRADVAAGAELVNLFAQQNPQGAKAPLVLHNTPGSKPFADLHDETPVRGTFPWKGKLYAVTNTGFYEVTGPDAAERKAHVAITGPISWAENGTVLVFVDGSRGYVFDGEDLTEIRDSAFYPSETVTFLDGYFIFSRSGKTGQFFISRLYSTEFDALDFATAEANPDGLVGVLADHRELWMFGERTVEVWWNSGAADFPFERIQGAVIEHGCASPWCMAKANNTVYWLSDEGIVYHAPGGYQPQRISTHDVEHDLTRRTLGRSYAFTYVMEGHWFYQLTVDDVTWCFDVATGLWHKRSHIDHGRHHASCYAFAFNRHLIGDFSRGVIHEWSLDIVHDDWRPLVSQAVCAPIHNQRSRARHKSFEVDFDAGHGLVTATALDPATDEWLTLGVEQSLHNRTWDADTPPDHEADAFAGSGVWTVSRNTVQLATGTKGGTSGLAVCRLYSSDAGGALENSELGRMGVYLDLAEEGYRGDIEYSIRSADILSGETGKGKWRVRVYQANKGGVIGDGDDFERTGVSSDDQADTFMPPDALASSLTLIDDTGYQLFGAAEDSKFGPIDFKGDYLSIVVEAGDPAADGQYAEVGERQVYILLESDPAYEHANAGVEPGVVLQHSDDGGRTWSNEREKSMGKEGERELRAIWYRLGQSRDRRYRVTITDPVPRRILGTAYVEAGP